MTNQQPSITLNQRVGQNIQRLRKDIGMSQEDLGRELGQYGMPWKQQTVLQVEAGRRPLKIDEWLTIGRVLRVDAQELLKQPDELSEALDEFRTAETAIAALHRERQQLTDPIDRQIARHDQNRHKAAAKLVDLYTAADRPDLAAFYTNLPSAEEQIATFEQVGRGEH